MAIIYALGSMFFWGLALFLAAISARKIGNVLTLFWMQVFGFITGSLYFFKNPVQVNVSLLSANIPVLAIVAFLQMIGALAYYKGTQKGSVSLVSPLSASYGLVASFLSIIFLKEVLKLNQIAAIILIISGIIIISISLKELLKNKNIQILSGTKEGIIAMLGWGISLFLLIYPTKELGWYISTITFRVLIILFLFLYINYKRMPFITKSARFPWALLLFIGLFDMAAFFSYSLGVSAGYGSIVAPVSSASTLVTIFLGVVFIKEKIDLRKFIGIASIVSGLILISI